jgi:hypothetical protein
MSTLFMFLVGGLALHRKSFHQMDLFGRQKEVRQWLGTSRYLVASDATFWRVLPGMDQPQIREELQQACELLRQKGHGKIALPEGRTLRAAAVDGSALGGAAMRACLKSSEPMLPSRILSRARIEARSFLLLKRFFVGTSSVMAKGPWTSSWETASTSPRT